MSKLRVDITYNHRLHNNLLFIKPTIIDTNDFNQNPNDLDDNINNLTDDLPIKDNRSEKLDDETDEPQLENEFVEYLQN